MNESNEKTQKTRRDELIRAACDVIAGSGFEGLRIREVAARIGINAATLYYYFPTKESMIAGVADYVFNRLGIVSEEPPGTPRDQLHAHLLRIYRLMRDEPGLFAIYAEMQLRAERNQSPSLFREHEAAWHHKLENLLQLGIRQGYWPNYLDPEQAANAIILLMQGASLQVMNNPRRIEASINQLERWLIGR